MRLLLLILCFLISSTSPAYAKESDSAEPSKNGALRVFLDCGRGCDFDFLRREIVYINYVRDRKDAQVHVLVTSQGTGGGREETLQFIGLGEFEGIDQRLLYTTSRTDTDDERRRGFARMLQFGLVRYVLETPLAAGLTIGYELPSEDAAPNTTPEDDPWNFWVFRARVNGSFSGESMRDSMRVGGMFSAGRTTEDWRISAFTAGNYSESNYEFEDEEDYTSTTRNFDLGGQAVKSLGEHWGLGFGASAKSSTYSNLELSYRAAMAVEYNIFPYSESSERQLTFSYFLGGTAFNFEEETVLSKTSDTLFDHGVLITFDTEQPWGESSVDLTISHYLDNTDLNRITLGGRLEYRVFRGLSVNVWGHVERVRDQIFLPMSDASEEEILLGIRALETDLSYAAGIGISYTFGSIYNNVVNSRLTGHSGGFHRISF